MSVDLSELGSVLIGQSVNRPNKETQGTLSGHAAGEPFEKLVYTHLKKLDPLHTFKQYEYLNDLYLRNPQHISLEQKRELFDSPTAFFLLSRGDKATEAWSPSSVFEEKQNDTADILYCDNGKFHLIDVKTRNIAKDSQAPNIISAYKLAQTCALIIDNGEYDNIEVSYIGIDWEASGDKLVCQRVHTVDLFKALPQDLYINWAAAMQIQFHVADLGQLFSGSREEWARAYIKVFVDSARSRVKRMQDKFITPYLKYMIDTNH
ncbi:MAG: HincII family type II restriction endonuclease [Porphyromonadaceae bacterium]|jgi:type-2 restriction enzyme hindII|nr:HincII family type II restriction endonuclease [Porphyromonadaceae bacterium]